MPSFIVSSLSKLQTKMPHYKYQTIQTILEQKLSQARFKLMTFCTQGKRYSSEAHQLMKRTEDLNTENLEWPLTHILAQLWGVINEVFINLGNALLIFSVTT